MFHEFSTTTTDMAVLQCVLGCSSAWLRTSSPCDVPFRYASGPIQRYRGTVARWLARLALLAWRAGTPMFVLWRHQFIRHPGSRTPACGPLDWPPPKQSKFIPENQSKTPVAHMHFGSSPGPRVAMVSMAKRRPSKQIQDEASIPNPRQSLLRGRL
jgi:hypothetical protein